jgi:hypothetical protein
VQVCVSDCWHVGKRQIFYADILASIGKEKVKLPLGVINEALYYEDIWGSGGIAPPFLTLALDGGEWSSLCPGHFTSGTHWIGDRVNRS